MPKPPNYLQKVFEIAKHAEKGGVMHIDVKHDSWCAIYVGKNCNCNPEVKIRDAN